MAGYRYERVIDPELGKRVPKLAFAREALAMLHGEVPVAAKGDVGRIAEFVRAHPAG